MFGFGEVSNVSAVFFPGNLGNQKHQATHAIIYKSNVLDTLHQRVLVVSGMPRYLGLIRVFESHTVIFPQYGHGFSSPQSEHCSGQ